MSSNTQAQPVTWVFWAIYALVAILLLRPVFGDSSMTDLMANDDLVRLVEVRDFLNGQGWADLMQYRMGPDGGTLMHWSRLVDAPIAAIIWLAALVMPTAQAEAVAMVVWPLLLAGGVLAILHRGGQALGGAFASNFAMLMGGLAIISTGKFDAGSFDHHNLQLMAILLALAALVAPSPSHKSGMVAGVACAVSLAIGLEGILFVAVLGGYVALLWVAIGQKARPQALGFSFAFAIGLAGLYLLLRPDFTATVFRCDAFGPDLLRVGLAGALGLVGLVVIGGRLSLAKRIIGVVVLAVLVAGFAKMVSPYCLTNPLDQLSSDVDTLWLSIIVEARSLISYIQLYDGQNAGFLVSPVLVMGIAVWLAFDHRYTARALLMLAMVAVAYGMTLYQIRGANFLMLISVLPAAAGLARLFQIYRSGSQKAGFGVLVLLVFSLPDVPTLIATQYIFAKSEAKTGAQLAASSAEKACNSQAAFAQFSNAPPGLVLANTNLGALLLAYTPHRVLTSNFHRNNAGIQAGIDIARAPVDEVPAMLRAFGVRYVVYCAGEAALEVPATRFPDGFWASLNRQEMPAFLTPVSQDGLVVLEFNDQKEP